MPSTLRARLSLSLFLMILVLAMFAASTLFVTQRLYLAEVQQKVNREVARHIVEERLLLRDDGAVDEQALEHVFHMLMVVNPSIEVYLLGNDGEVLGYSAQDGRAVAERVPLEPLRRFLAPGAKLPILGFDPRHPETRQPFSAAPVETPGGRRGYLYVIVGSEPYRSVAELLASSYALKLGAIVLCAGLLVALLFGLLLLRWQTRRLSALSRAVDTFRAGGFKQPTFFHRAPGEDDEFGRLERSFADMMQRIVEQLDRIERAEAERRELIASISHDLRTPLASLRGYLETLQLKSRSVSPAERDRHLSVALKQASRLSKLVEELFELSKLDSGHMEIHPEIFSLAELVQDVVQKLEPTARTRRIRLEAVIPEHATPVYGDIGLIERALTNVIDNAIKYSRPAGSVRVQLRSSGPHLSLSVYNDGPGISAEELPRVFEPFYRSMSARQTNAEGSGLGLAIAQGILRMHDTVIRARSEPGKGTEFLFDLPVHARSREHPTMRPPP